VLRCGKLIQGGRKAPKHAAWLRSTLIPDLRAAGMPETAKDLARCARYIGK